MHQFTFCASYEALVAALGEPDARDLDSNGLGPFDLFTLSFACGLEIGLWSLVITSDGAPVPPGADRFTMVFASEHDYAHLAHHLPVTLRHVCMTVGYTQISAHRPWSLTRQDDNGNVFFIDRFSSRCEADAALAKFEALGHKQTYFVGRGA